MLTIPTTAQIYFYNGKIDFRKGIDGLMSVCQVELKVDPFLGSLFVFMNSGRTCLRILYYDGQGFWLAHKRLSRGKFHWRPTKNDSSDLHLSLLARELQVLLWNGDFENARMQSNWKDLSHGEIVEK